MSLTAFIIAIVATLLFFWLIFYPVTTSAINIGSYRLFFLLSFCEPIILAAISVSAYVIANHYIENL